MAYVFLAVAIAMELSATLSLKVATGGRRAWYAVVVVGYLGAFVMLSLTLDAGLGLGVAYGIWSAVGVALTAVASYALFGEPFTRLMALGIVLIIGGVLLIELG
jgi:small multidrug resistance pump